MSDGPAFSHPGAEMGMGIHDDMQPQKGMSKRFYAAVHIMQGILANPTDMNSNMVAPTAWSFAGQLLAEEDKNES